MKSLRSAVPAVLLAALASIACSGSEDATSTATPAAGTTSSPPAATATAEPRPAPAGRILYYMEGYSQRRLVAHDVEAGETWWSMDLVPSYREGNSTPQFSATLVGDAIAVSDGKLITLISHDGSSTRTLLQAAPDDRFADVAGSPDGRYLAMSLSLPYEQIGTPGPEGAYRVRVRSAVQLIDPASGQVRQTVDADDPRMAGFAGSMHWLVWRDDSSGVVVSGSTSSEKPGGAATIFVDGDVVQHEIRGYLNIAPGGRSIAHGPSTFGCMAVAGHEISILNTDANADLVSVEDPGLAMYPLAWSPDGLELLIASRTYDAAHECGFDLEEPEALRVLDVTTGQVQVVSDRLSVAHGWYGDDLLEARGCGAYDGPLTASRWNEVALVCLPGGGIGVGSFLLGGEEMARTDAFEVIGWIRK